MEERIRPIDALGTKVVFAPTGLINLDVLKRPRGGIFHQLMTEERNRDVGRAISGAYSNLESSFEEFRFPNPIYFSAERFVSELEKTGWNYDRISRNARRPIELEEIPDLLEYNGRGNIEKVVQNAEKRVRTFNVEMSHYIMFSSPKHGEVLSQELYEAGWHWRPKYMN